ncbi:MAG: DsbC family protein [Gammaproteobacteria bacterium]
MFKKSLFVLLGVAIAWAATAFSADSKPGIDTVKAAFPGLGDSDIHETPVEGWYEIMLGTQVAYVSADAKYVLRGELIELATNYNYTESRLNDARVKTLAAVNNDEAIMFSPNKVKHSLTVFTDIDCGYCRKLHSEMEDLESLGVEVKYLFFPRAGPGSASWDKAESVWCADDRNVALTAAKAGKPVAPKACGDAAIKAQYDLGRQVGLTGTPTIVTSSGELISGYLPAQRLVARLEDAAKKASAAKE